MLYLYLTRCTTGDKSITGVYSKPSEYKPCWPHRRQLLAYTTTMSPDEGSAEGQRHPCYNFVWVEISSEATYFKVRYWALITSLSSLPYFKLAPLGWAGNPEDSNPGRQRVHQRARAPGGRSSQRSRSGEPVNAWLVEAQVFISFRLTHTGLRKSIW